jgi:hypothetical protein
VTRHGFNLHVSVTIATGDDLAGDDLGRERLCRYGLRPPFSLSRFRVLRGGRISYRVKKSARRSSRCRLTTPVQPEYNQARERGEFVGRLATR